MEQVPTQSPLSAMAALVHDEPARARRAGLGALLVAFVALVGLVVFGKTERVVTTRGRIIPVGYVQVMQPAHGGSIEALLVREGSRVSAGDVVARLESAVPRAKLMASQSELEWVALALARFDSELRGVAFAPPAGVSEAARHRAEAHFDSAVRAHRLALEQEQRALDRLRNERRALDANELELVETLERFRAEEAAIDELLAKGYVSKLQALEKERQRISAEQQLVAVRHRRAGAADGIAQQGKRVESLRAERESFLREESEKLASNRDRLVAGVAEAEDVLAATELRAPTSGVIKDLATHTIGSVVAPGTVLATLVPDGEPLTAEVWIENQDIEHVDIGRAVKVKLDALDFRRYGVFLGRVAQVTEDATASSERPEAAGLAPGSYQYRALVEIEPAADGRANHRFTAGMQLTAEIIVGERTVLAYLVSPLQKVAAEAGQEP